MTRLLREAQMQKRPGVIPGAPHVPWLQNREAVSLTSAADQAFANRRSTSSASAVLLCALSAAASPNRTTRSPGTA